MSRVHDTKVFFSDCEELMATAVIMYEEGSKNIYLHYNFTFNMGAQFTTDDCFSEEFDNLIKKVRTWADSNNCILYAY